MKILFTCGGTAGHINPALGLAGQICHRYPGSEVLFVGAEGRMETELVPAEGYPIETIRIAGFQRGFSWNEIKSNIKLPFRIMQSNHRAKQLLRDFQPDVAVGTGGYVCYPVLNEAAKMGIPTVVHESNALPGLTTKLLEKSVDRILVGFEECRSGYKYQNKVVVTGTPVRVAFQGTDRSTAHEKLGIDRDTPIVVAAFGSLGASYMNRCMREMIMAMGSTSDFRLIYATGKQYYPAVSAWMLEQDIDNPNIDVRDYIYDMADVMTAADLVICRAGASTISELTYLGKPAVIIPSPNVVNHHQEKNAAVLDRAGAAKMLQEGEFDGSTLYQTVYDLLHNQAALETMHKKSLELGTNDATDRIVNIIAELANRSAR